MLRTLGNIIWFLCGGIVMGLAWWLVGVLAFISIIGIPFALQHLKLAVISLAPIGKTVVPIEEVARARYRAR
ncbi:hypothetical protein GOP97_10475 [Vibrio cholerae]|uniref:YccF domain-containing protein n=1 Tax=Vibrio cholerae TaxID=666 RepID=UPI002DBF5CFE|nr:YccF domain-containing protein [Vibrio cholerae]MEB5556180.1 hypothetical protein [Vibrio cholerae]